MFGALARRMGADDRAIRRFLLGSLALGLACLIGALVAAALVAAASQRHTAWVDHTHEVRVVIRQAQLLVEEGETTRRGYLLTGQPVYLGIYRRAVARIPPTLDQLQRLTRDNSRQQANIGEYRRRIAALSAHREQTIALVSAHKGDAAVAMFAVELTAGQMPAVRDQAARIDAEEARLLVLRDAAQRASLRTFFWIITAAGVVIAAVALITLATVLRYTADLNVTSNRLRELNDTLEDQVAERTADLTRANEEIQRFAYIVSHDLRSPLVNVMGFTAELAAATQPLGELIDRVEAEAPQLLTEEARLAAREDLPEAVGFIRTSTQKMDRLINAILKLSREGRRTIAAEPLDTDALVDGIVGSIRHLLDERGVTLEVAKPLPAITSDRVAVEQILSNLIENATKYLQPGRPGAITVSGERARDRIAIAVADNGRGIAAADHQRVFDLFRRSGTQDQPGEGIGLAHVRALAYRLGGTIDLQSELGVGSTFRLVLPVTFAPQGSRA